MEKPLGTLRPIKRVSNGRCTRNEISFWMKEMHDEVDCKKKIRCCPPLCIVTMYNDEFIGLQMV